MNYEYRHEAFRDTREKLGLTQRDLAKIIDCTEKIISNYEAGRSAPNGYVVSMINLLCKKKEITEPRLYDLPEDPFSLVSERRKILINEEGNEEDIPF